MLNTEPAELEDFSGGVTDDIIDAPINAAQYCDNLLITPNQKLKTAPGSRVYSNAAPQLPTGSARIRALVNFDDQLVAQAEQKLLIFKNDSWIEAVTPSGDPLPAAMGDTASVNMTDWNGHLIIANDKRTKPLKAYIDENGVFQCVTAGLPRVDTENTRETHAAGSFAFIYGFHYYRTYQVGDVIYEDFGPVTYHRVENAPAPDSSSIVLNDANLVEGNTWALSNGTDEHYDTTNTVIRIYRTQADGDILNLLDEIPANSTSYEDATADSAIVNEPALYTEGGTLSNDAPPESKYVHVSQGACYYGNVKDSGGNVLNYRLLQSVVSDPDSVPVGNYLDFDKEITGISSYADRLIVFTKSELHRVEGIYDELGLGGMTSDTIDNTIGCICHNSIVQIPQGLVFADEDGFAFTDGVSAIRINEQWTKRYKNLVKTDKQRKRIVGSYDKQNKRVYWAVQTDDSESSDVDAFYVLDLRYGISTRSSYTSLSGGELRPQDMAPSSFTFLDGNLIRGDKRGYIFEHKEEYLTNPLIDTTATPDNWGTSPIIYNFTSIASSFGNRKFRKFTPKMILACENVSNLSLQITSISDLSKSHTVKELRFRGNFVWGDTLFTWGDPNFRWGAPGFIQQQRHFDSRALRSTYKQIKLSNANTIVANSDAISVVTTNTTTKTLTLDSASAAWPDDLITYSIAFEEDGYVREYPILSRDSNTVITVQDSAGNMPSGSGLKWVMRGYAKGEVLSLISLTVLYAYLGQTQKRYTPDSEGGNA